MNTFTLSNLGARRARFVLTVAALALFTTACPSSAPVVVEDDSWRPPDLAGLGVVDAYNVGIEALHQEPPDYVTARASFERVVEQTDLVWEASMNLGVIYTDLALYSDAGDAFNTVLRAEPESPADIEAYMGLGKAYALWGLRDEALEAYRSVIQADNENVLARLNIAAIYVDNGDPDQARQFIREVLVAEQNNVDALNLLGRIYNAEGDRQMATYLWEKSLGLDANAVDALNNMALLDVDDGKMGRAARQFARVASNDPANVAAHMNLGAIYLNHINYGDALYEFEQVLALRPRHESALMGRAAALYGLGENAEAYAAYSSVVDNYGENDAAMFRAGDIAFRDLDDLDAAEQWFRRNLSQRGMNPESCDRTDEACARLLSIARRRRRGVDEREFEGSASAES